MTQTIIKVPAAGAFDPTDITIDDNTLGAFLIQDSATEYYRINSGTSGPRYALKTGLTNQYLIQNGVGTGETQLRNGAYNQLYMTGLDTTRALVRYFFHDQYTGGYFRIRDSGSADIFRLDEDSNATFTLNDHTSVFRVNDDTATPDHLLYIKPSNLDGGSENGQVKLGSGLTNAGDRYLSIQATSAALRCQNAFISFTPNSSLLFTNSNDQTFRIDNVHTGGDFVFEGKKSGGSYADIFRLDGNTNSATFRMRGGQVAADAGTFLVKDDATTPVEYFKVDADPAASLIEFNVPSGQGAGMTVNLPADGTSGNPNTGFQCTVPGGAGFLKFGRQASGIYTGGTAFQVSAGNANLSVQGNQFLLQSSSPDIVMNLNASTVDFKVTDAADATILEVKEDSSLTHTLDETSGAVFKVVDDAASPNTYLKAVEAGSISTERNFEIYNSTAPAASVTDGCILFCEDVSSSSELKVRDEAGNVTTLSPHNFSLIPEGPSEEMAWSYYSEKDGKKINVDMLRLARLVEQISGEQIIFEEG